MSRERERIAEALGVWADAATEKVEYGESMGCGQLLGLANDLDRGAAALRDAAGEVERMQEMREVLEQMRTFIRDGWDGAVRLQSSSIAADIYADSLFRRVDALLESD
jgi:hypothetical protein